MRFCVLRFRSQDFEGSEPETIVFLEQKDGSIKKFGPDPGEDLWFAEWYAGLIKELNGSPDGGIDAYTHGFTYWDRWEGDYSGDEKAIVDNALKDIG